MKKKKKLIIIVIVVALTVFVISFVVRHLKELNAQIPDTNGASKELSYYSDEYIEYWNEDYSIIGRNTHNENLNDSGVEGRYEKKDFTYNRTSLGSLSGIYVLNAYLADGKEITYTVDSEVLRGNLRIIVTDQRNKILYDIPIDEKAELTFQTEKGAIYYVKLVGESAKVKLEFWRDRET